MPAILWLALGGITLTVGDIVLKSWIERSLPYASILYIGGLGIYLVGLVFLVESFRTQNIAIASAIFVIFNIVTLALVSWLYFGDKISLMQGLVVALVAIVILELAK